MKKNILRVIIILLVTAAAVIWFWNRPQQYEELTPEKIAEVLESLSAPEEMDGKPLTKEEQRALESLTAPVGGSKI